MGRATIRSVAVYAAMDIKADTDDLRRGDVLEAAQLRRLLAEAQAVVSEAERLGLPRLHRLGLQLRDRVAGLLRYDAGENARHADVQQRSVDLAQVLERGEVPQTQTARTRG